MKVTGTATLAAPRDQVWRALLDPGVLVRTIPGCLELRAVGRDSYEMKVMAGVASIKGTYLGTVELADQQPLESYRLVASGQGAPGTVRAEAVVRLSDDGEGRTRLDYDADAVVGGMIGGVGQRVLVGVAKKTAGEFFAAVDRHLAGEAVAEVPPVPEQVPPPREPDAVGQPAPTAGAVFRAPERAGRQRGAAWALVAAAGVGALSALAGVALGWYFGRRSRG